MILAIMIFVILQTLFIMALVGHLSTVEKLLIQLTQAKVEEMKMWSSNEK